MGERGGKSAQGRAHAEGGEQGGEAGIIAFAVCGNQGILVFAHAGIFLGSVAQAQQNHLFGICLAAAQAGLELIGGHVDVHIGIGAADGGIIAGADAGSALNINVHYHILTGLQQVDDIALEGAVAVAVHRGVLQEFTGGYLGGKHLGGEEVVIHAILLARAGLAGGAGDGIGGEAVLLCAAAKGGLAAAGGTGYDEECTKHSQ